MINLFTILIVIDCILALIFTLRCLILLFVYDYEAWKRKKKEKDYYHKVEDKFKNRKLTD